MGSACVLITIVVSLMLTVMVICYLVSISQQFGHGLKFKSK